MKRYFCLLLFVSSISVSRAQFALIPDTNFRNFLMNNGFAGCITGNTLDTTCTAVITATKINCTGYSIHSLTGIEYFDNLDTLICSNNFYLPSIPRLSDSVSYIDCSGCLHLTTLGALPVSLLQLNCIHDSLTALPSLPPNLIVLYCNNNFLTNLPALPVSLSELYCYGNLLNSLPALPSNLLNLTCWLNNIQVLPTLPVNLEILSCGYNYHLQLPLVLPDSLKTLECYNDSLTSLPALPLTLETLNCSNNQIAGLPVLPLSLRSLKCGYNNLDSLPILPQYLGYIACQFNNLIELPTLPDPHYLYHLECQNNQLDGMGNFTLKISSWDNNFYFDCSNNPNLGYIGLLSPYPVFSYFNCSNCDLMDLPYPLYFNINGAVLNCDNNNIMYLPSFGGYLHVSCRNNQITYLPSFQSSVIFTLDCGHNNISDITSLPDSIGTLRIDSNPIACLPEIHKIGSLSWGNTNIHCLPNYGNIYSASPPINNLPLCQPSDNCPSMWNLTGQVFFDSDSSCTQDTGEIGLKEIPVVLDSNGLEIQRFLTDNFGRYSFRTGQGNYTIWIDTASAPFRVVCPATFFETALLNVVDSMDTVPSFGLLCNTGFDLISKSIAPLQMFRPGFQNTIYLDAGEGMSFSGINCTSAIGGSVRVVLNSLVAFVSPANGALTPSSVIGDTINWSISDFSLIDPVHDFNIIVQVSVSATINDTVCFLLEVMPIVGDHIPANNSLAECFPVRGAVDPNEKYMSPSGLVDTSKQWFTFTIFFQNVGNAPAENIYILDTLDQNLDATTFSYLSSSHEAITQLLPGNTLRFNYPGINLVDSTTDEPGSHGYVQYKVKRKANLPVNTTISNTAYIYFDFNAAVATNTVAATLSLNVTTAEIEIPEFHLYPNPVNNKLVISIASGSLESIKSIVICDLLGKNLMTKHLESGINIATIDVDGLSQGVYFIKLQTENYSATKRFVKN